MKLISALKSIYYFVRFKILENNPKSRDILLMKVHGYILCIVESMASQKEDINTVSHNLLRLQKELLMEIDRPQVQKYLVLNEPQLNGLLRQILSDMKEVNKSLYFIVKGQSSYYQKLSTHQHLVELAKSLQVQVQEQRSLLNRKLACDSKLFAEILSNKFGIHS